MKAFILMVFFATSEVPIPFEGTPYGYGHRSYDTLEKCLKRRDTLTNYLTAQIPTIHQGHRTQFAVFCAQVKLEGYDEGMENFRRSIGDAM